MAVIEKVKQGSVADLVGHLLPGDQVLEWNGISLHTRTYEDVRDIIAASRQENSIELVVSRDIENSRPTADWEVGGPRSSMLSLEAGLERQEPRQDSRSRSPPSRLGCRLQVKTWYDRARQELIVTVLSAVDLPARTGGQYRNPYSKLFLLPDRRYPLPTIILPTTQPVFIINSHTNFKFILIAGGQNVIYLTAILH